MKHITPVEKLVLLLVADWNPMVMNFNLTSQEIGNVLGLNRRLVLDALGQLEERDYIECIIGYRSRETKITNRLKDLIETN